MWKPGSDQGNAPEDLSGGAGDRPCLERTPLWDGGRGLAPSRRGPSSLRSRTDSRSHSRPAARADGPRAGEADHALGAYIRGGNRVVVESPTSRIAAPENLLSRVGGSAQPARRCRTMISSSSPSHPRRGFVWRELGLVLSRYEVSQAGAQGEARLGVRCSPSPNCARRHVVNEIRASEDTRLRDKESRRDARLPLSWLPREDAKLPQEQIGNLAKHRRGLLRIPPSRSRRKRGT